MPQYEIRPHHCFKGWFLVFRDGISLRAFTSKVEAEAYISRQRTLANLKKREIQL